MEVVFNIESEEDFKNVLDNVILGLYDKHNNSFTLLNESSIAAAKDEMKDIIFTSHCNAERVYELLLSKGYEKERSQIVSSLIENRGSELLYSTLLNYNSVHGETVAMLDWVVKLVYGTSELKKLKYPLLQLSFTTISKGDQQQRNYDINKEMLIKMINILEDIEQ